MLRALVARHSGLRNEEREESRRYPRSPALGRKTISSPNDLRQCRWSLSRLILLMSRPCSLPISNSECNDFSDSLARSVLSRRSRMHARSLRATAQPGMLCYVHRPSVHRGKSDTRDALMLMVSEEDAPASDNVFFLFRQHADIDSSSSKQQCSAQRVSDVSFCM